MKTRFNLIFNSARVLGERSTGTDRRDALVYSSTTFLDVFSVFATIVGFIILCLDLFAKELEGPHWPIYTTWLISISFSLATAAIQSVLANQAHARRWVAYVSVLRLCFCFGILTLFIKRPVISGKARFTFFAFILTSCVFRFCNMLLSYYGFRIFRSMGHLLHIKPIQRMDELSKQKTEEGYSSVTGRRVVYLDSVQAARYCDLATERMKGDAIDREALWYHPNHMLKKDVNYAINTGHKGPLFKLMKRYPKAASKSILARPPPSTPTLFSECYCCLDQDLPQKISDPVSEQGTAKRRTKEMWETRRDQFLKRRSINHLGTGVHGQLSTTMCLHCAKICQQSKIIATATQTQLEARKRPERWDHWPTVHELKSSADNGCHLCTLIWSLMSVEQQLELLRIDRLLAVELKDALIKESTEKGRNKISLKFYQQRAIRICVEKAKSYSMTSAAKFQRTTRTPMDGAFSFSRIIPHYGGFRIPQRWLSMRAATRAISMGLDPAVLWHFEQVEAIYLSPPSIPGGLTRNSSCGRVILPLGDYTNSQTTFDFIKSVLNAHQHCHVRGGSQSGSQTPYSRASSDNGSDVELSLLSRPGNLGESEFLPMRLIDVGTNDTDLVVVRSSSSIRQQFLTLSSGFQEPPKYLALSHCWGKSEFLLLTTKTMEELYRGVPVTRLAQTFQDAVAVTRRLGVRYIWIDSLCIIQDSDSDDDWQRNAASMKDVYTNAECVLVALAAWDSSQTFFAPQKPLEMSPCLLDVIGTEGPNVRGIYALPQRRFSDDAWHEEVTLSRWQSRAWCFQEAFLANKLIYFGQHQVFFRCKSPNPEVLRDYVTYQTGASPWLPDRSYYHFRDYDLEGFTFGLQHEPIRVAETDNTLKRLLSTIWSQRILSPWKLHDVYTSWLTIGAEETHAKLSLMSRVRDKKEQLSTDEEWWEVVAEYTSRFITKDSDNMIALDGIANAFQHKKDGETYIWGLWGPASLSMGLLWYIGRHRGIPSKAPVTPSSSLQTFPTWSWAAASGQVRNNSYDGGTATSGLRILEIQRGLFKVQDINIASPARLRVIGCVKAARWQMTVEAKDKLYYKGHHRHQFETLTQIDLEHYRPYSNDTRSGPEALKLLDPATQANIGLLIPDSNIGVLKLDSDILEILPEIVYCLKIVVEPMTNDMKNDFGIAWATRGIALVPTNTGNPSEYRRVGYFELEKTYGGVTYPYIFSPPEELNMRDPKLPIRQPRPDIDIHGFFKGFNEQELFII